MALSPGSGNFRTKIGTARTFGVIETRQGKDKLTDLGFSIVDEDRPASRHRGTCADTSGAGHPSNRGATRCVAAGRHPSEERR